MELVEYQSHSVGDWMRVIAGRTIITTACVELKHALCAPQRRDAEW